MMATHQEHPPPLRVGAALALLSATLFGVSTPLVRRFGAGQGAFVTASLLYAGAALASVVVAGPGPRDAPLGRRDLPRLAMVAVAGAVVAPACLAWGLARTNALLGSLLLTSEAVFTVLLARMFYREPASGRVASALACIALGSALLVRGAGTVSAANALGSVVILLASLAWALDNTLTRPLADKNPGHVVAAKSSIGALISLVVATGEHRPSLRAAGALLLTGALGYGVSLRFYLLAQRRIGAGRTASVFGAAPFVGALTAWGIGDAAMDGPTLLAGLLVALGLYLHLSERHGHAHVHAPIDHEHMHSHDDGHHDHSHHPPIPGPHSHAHHHEATEHEHPHASDLHHQHSHR